MIKTVACIELGTISTEDLLGDTTPEWFVVVAFHPQTDCIGAYAALKADDDPLVIGRPTPLRSPTSGGSLDIGDVHVSRKAFVLKPVPGSADWVLQRPPGSSRLQVDGENIREDLLLTPLQLKAGLVITLAQRVVLHLRLQARFSAAAEAAFGLPDLLGVSAAMRRVQSAVRAAASSPDDVLLLGATGTGKECAARAIHTLSDRARAPWVAVNMAALPAEIAAASLFGARRGAYTGADSHRAGYFQRAQGGTLFLDEIGDTPEALQPMLLRALQERELQVVGGAVETVDLRVIAATEHDPDSAQTRLRSALRYRLAAQEIRLPTLAERAEDIGLLAASFLRQALGPDKGWSPDASTPRGAARWAKLFECLLRYDWPGNVRELQQLVRQLSSTAHTELVVSRSLLEKLTPAPKAVDGSRSHKDASDDEVREMGSSQQRLAELSDAEFQEVWSSARYEVASIARRFGVSRATVYRRLRGTPGCRLAAEVPERELITALEGCDWDRDSAAAQLQVSVHGLDTRLRASGLRAPVRDESV